MSSFPPPPPGKFPPDPSLPQIPPATRAPRPMAGDLALKVLIWSAAAMTLGFGTCSVSAAALTDHGKVGQALIALGAGAFFLGFAGLLISFVWLLVSLVAGATRR